jgi:hypothetical protein
MERKEKLKNFLENLTKEELEESLNEFSEIIIALGKEIKRRK